MEESKKSEENMAKEDKEEEDSEEDIDLKNEKIAERDYGYRENAYVLPKDDCFFKLEESLKKESELEHCNISILHSRIAEVKNEYEATNLNNIPNDHAHPNIDFKNRIALFHNGRIANSEDLLKKLQELKVELSPE